MIFYITFAQHLNGKLAAQRAVDLPAIGLYTQQSRGTSQYFIEDNHLSMAGTEFIKVFYQRQQPIFVRGEDELIALVDTERVLAGCELME